MKKKATRNWAELPPELTAAIMIRLAPFEILTNTQKVCKSWRRISKDPSLWRKIDMRNQSSIVNTDIYSVRLLCYEVVNRSQGGLLEINIGMYFSYNLLTYVADRSSNLRKLEIEVLTSNEELVNAVAKLPLLEELVVSCPFIRMNLKAIGHSCPKLKLLKVNLSSYKKSWFKCDDDDAFEIAESMPELRHLQLLGNRITETGLKAILDNCPHLEHLDVRKCLNINLVGDLEKRCLERIKVLRRPNDSTFDYLYYIGFGNTYLSDNDDLP